MRVRPGATPRTTGGGPPCPGQNGPLLPAWWCPRRSVTRGPTRERQGPCVQVPRARGALTAADQPECGPKGTAPWSPLGAGALALPCRPSARGQETHKVSWVPGARCLCGTTVSPSPSPWGPRRLGSWKSRQFSYPRPLEPGRHETVRAELRRGRARRADLRVQTCSSRF